MIDRPLHHRFFTFTGGAACAALALTKVAVQRYHPIQTKEATILVSALLVDSENREKHVQRTTASTMLSILYDHPTVASGKDKTVQEIDKDVQFFSSVAIRTALVEFFPWIYTFPRGQCFVQIFSIAFTYKESIGLQSGREKPWNKLPYVPRCFYNYSITSKRTL